jgi:hypothetical protein
MNANPNIYHAVVFHLHPKIKDFLDQLDTAGQIDHDEMNAPHLVSADPVGPSIFRCVFMRNCRPEHFVLHTRKKADPVRSWSDDDGFVRQERVVIAQGEPSRKERSRRAINPFESIMEQILRR